ncbi:MAG: hypothetical protein AAB336_01285 [Acidobacteriota bacterium]
MVKIFSRLQRGNSWLIVPEATHLAIFLERLCRSNWNKSLEMEVSGLIALK